MPHSTTHHVHWAAEQEVRVISPRASTVILDESDSTISSRLDDAPNDESSSPLLPYLPQIIAPPALTPHQPAPSPLSLALPLAYDRVHSDNWDMRKDPTLFFSPEELAMQATEPLSTSVTVVIDLVERAKSLPWIITVTGPRSRMEMKPPVTVRHVVQRIYEILQLQFSEQEFHALRDREWQLESYATYKTRYREIKDEEEHKRQKKDNMKRVDLLCTSYLFGGMALGPDRVFRLRAFMKPSHPAPRGPAASER
ncbi:hypothetical protein K474DRAFT_1673987 [Panus rudis PR-1116 ss-1]|nr:hypothetical protein K474DRAFT_1673987 [Panus rudis PR-1116 ss-1]